MIFDYFKKRREDRAAKIREQEERRQEEIRLRQDEYIRHHLREPRRPESPRSSYDNTPYVAPNYSTYDSASTWSDSSSSSSSDSSSSSCDSGSSSCD